MGEVMAVGCLCAFSHIQDADVPSQLPKASSQHVRVFSRWNHHIVAANNRHQRDVGPCNWRHKIDRVVRVFQSLGMSHTKLL